MQDTIRFVLDDRIVEIGFSESSGLRPTTTVLNYLRSLPLHKGVKEGCAEGDCGACTVVIAEAGEDGGLVYRAIDSCLVFLPMIHGKQLITVENLALVRGSQETLHPVQEMLVATNGSQCGYCTPGVVMSMFGLYKNHQYPSNETIGDALAGNLCRCTGYRSVQSAAKKSCCGSNSDHFAQNEAVIAGMLGAINANRETIEIEYGGQRYIRPFTLREALRYRDALPSATIVSGSTDVALRQTKNGEYLPCILDLSGIETIKTCREEQGEYIFGAGLSLEKVRSFAEQKLPALYKTLSLFGSLQIRNLATLGGNTGTASPVGDTLPVLIAYGAKVSICSKDSGRIIGIEDFIRGYRKTALLNNELITEIIIPIPDAATIVSSFKVSRRRDVDISTVSAAFRLQLQDGRVSGIVMAYGGMDSVPRRAFNTEKFLAGKEWSRKSVMRAMDILSGEFAPLTDVRAGSSYRKSICRNLLMKFFVETTHPVRVVDPVGVVDPVRVEDPVRVCENHATGESVFIEDIQVNGQLLLGKVVYSRHAHALIRSIDTSDALQVKGVRCILTAKDIPGENQMGAVIHDEPCLAENEVTFIGQAVALIAAETEEAAREAERHIRINYDPLPAILDITSAMEAGSRLSPARKIERGDVEAALEKAPHVIRGELTTGAQEHWYLETQTALAIPGEGREMALHASTQNPAETQAIVAEVLDIAKNEVEVEVRRIGGAFGGKETQGNHVAAWAALLAHATRQPVRIHLFREDDQVMTGKRHRFLSKYEIGFDDQGTILAYKVELNSDAGSSTDLSRAILERAMLHADNAYYLPNVSITGQAWKTNLPSNTAFRGFGGPQAMAVIENAIDRIARFLKKDAADIRYLNFYRPGEHNLTPYNEKVKNNHLSRIFNKLVETSAYRQRRQETDHFNRENEFHKKGLAITPVKFGISFTTSFLNQAGALVNVYTDGTVIVNHGGTEMGQGLHEKILRIAAAEFGISPGYIRVSATNTSKVPNTSPTAASSGSDLNGMAVKNAIEKIKGRLRKLAVSEFSSRNPRICFTSETIEFSNNFIFDSSGRSYQIPFRELCSLARIKQVSLSATGFYKTPGIYFDRDSGQGNPFLYYAYGMAVSEVMIDTLTGAHQLLRTDILHDAGDSIHEAIDTGQVEGGFIQGAGWCTTEEIKWDKAGNLLTRSPDTYKIPAFNDIPKDFRVELLKGSPNPGTIRGSKAVGEPPFMLGLSVWLAIKDAISAVASHEKEPVFRLPATGEVILAAVEDLKKSG